MYVRDEHGGLTRKLYGDSSLEGGRLTSCEVQDASVSGP